MKVEEVVLMRRRTVSGAVRIRALPWALATAVASGERRPVVLVHLPASACREEFARERLSTWVGGLP